MTRSRKRKLARNRAKWAGMPLASAILASGGAAYAAADTEQATLEEVVVTAQKRTEDLQKVPISLQVLGGEKLEEADAGPVAGSVDQGVNESFGGYGNERGHGSKTMRKSIR